jgi:peptidoglycan/xylan/chitin deacetylase (PgdA/CDA1 family)
VAAPQAGAKRRPAASRPLWLETPRRSRSGQRIAGGLLSFVLLAGLGDAVVAGRSNLGSMIGLGGASFAAPAGAVSALGSGDLGSPSASGLLIVASPPFDGPPAPTPPGATGVPAGPRIGPPVWPTPDDVITAAASVNLVYRVKTSHKVVALTFDDGWSPARGRQILDILLKNHVAATFFVNSVYVRWDPALWRKIAQDGFPIGNHTYDHRDLTKLTPTEVIADLEKNASEFKALTGQSMAPIVRPPYGARNDMTDGAIVLAGDRNVILWNAVAGDAAANPAPAAEIASATRGGPGSIVLLHVGPVTTPRILQAIINSYRSRGFTFLTIPQLLALQKPS